MTEYYLLHEGQEEGPFDYVAMVRKIKNRSLTPERLVRFPDGRTAEAGTAEEFKEFFLERAQTETQPDFTSRGEKIYSIKHLLKNSADFAMQQNSVLIGSGIFLVSSGIIFAILQKIPLVGIALGFTGSYVLFGGFCYAMLRKSRGQALELSQVVDVLKLKYKELLLTGAIISVPFAISFTLPIFLILPLIATTLCAFTPFLIAERDISALDAIETSRKRVMAMDMNNIAIILALMLINAVGGAIVIGLLISLPITMLALAEMYDELFND